MTTLPKPDQDALAHSAKLKQHLVQRMQTQGGAISFAEFMQQTLYAPGLGYYAAGSRKFGAEGDFITAPELSPLFAQSLARQCIDVLAHTPAQQLLEIGAGTGIMAADILAYLEQQQQLPEQYAILEASPELQQRQRATLQDKVPHLINRVQWLSELPTAFSGIILANELLDALPVHLFELTENGLFEKYVTVSDNDTLAWVNRPASDRLTAAVNAISDFQPITPPYLSEICLALPDFIKDVSTCLDQGVILFIDYGFPQREYYHPERYTGTLMCHYRHHSHPDPLQYLGLQDITAHVDFTAVALAAEQQGLDLLGYTHQASFLLNCGLMEQSEHASQVIDYQQKQAIKRLTLPSEMGELFKVIALGKHHDHPLIGLHHLDQSHRL